jgi:hypothetical protein
MVVLACPARWIVVGDALAIVPFANQRIARISCTPTSLTVAVLGGPLESLAVVVGESTGALHVIPTTLDAAGQATVTL